MAKLPACDCRHLGHCPIAGHPDTRRTDLQGRPLWRPLTSDEDPRGPEKGDLCSVAEDGNPRVEARAIDPEHVAAYGRSKENKQCKASKWLWRFRHPVPRFEHETRIDPDAERLRAVD